MEQWIQMATEYKIAIYSLTLGDLTMHRVPPVSGNRTSQLINWKKLGDYSDLIPWTSKGSVVVKVEGRSFSGSASDDTSSSTSSAALGREGPVCLALVTLALSCNVKSSINK